MGERTLLWNKYEGTGNDFIVAFADDENAVTAKEAQALCDRHFGIGADGVLLVLPPVSAGADARMRVINADGSIPEMCGNGLRCAVMHVARARKLREGTLVFDTDAGLRSCIVDDREGHGRVASGVAMSVTVDMGIVRVLEKASIAIDDDRWDFVLADAGNPHAITTRPATRATIDAVGLRLATHATFPRGSNIEFARFGDHEIDLVVFERGVGVTLACGTGACATAAVAVNQGLFEVDREVSVHLPGGTLGITIRPDGRAIMRGPARFVFSCELPAPSDEFRRREETNVSTERA